MKIYTVKDRTQELYHDLTDIWENSVRATHTFLNGEDIEKIKTYAPATLKNVNDLVVAATNTKPIAFIGVNNQKIEMLFVADLFRRQGIGKQLIDYAVKRLSATTVTVNEQNLQAVGFYKHMGFETYKKTDFDEQGNPYPLLYMKLKTAAR